MKAFTPIFKHCFIKTWFLLAAATIATFHPALSAAKKRNFDIRAHGPYLVDGPCKAARDHMRVRHYDDAVTAFKKCLPRLQHQVAQAQFLYSYALLKSGDIATAATQFRRLVHAYPLLANYHRYYGAIALYRQKKFDEALSLLTSIGKQEPLYWDASLLRADCLSAKGLSQQTVDIWQEYLAKWPNSSRSDEAHLRLAQALEKGQRGRQLSDRLQLARRAAAHYKRIIIASPNSRLASVAKKALKKISSNFPSSERAKLVKLSATELFQQGRAYYRRMRHQEAETTMNRVLNHPASTPEQRCRACYLRAKSVMRARERTRAVSLFSSCIKLCRKAHKLGTVVKSRYNMGRCLYSVGDLNSAGKTFRELERLFPKHSYADDALLQAAYVYADANDDKRATALLTSIAKKFPAGDMARTALWRLALADIEKQRLSSALRRLNQLRLLGRPTAHYEQGRAQYWLGRVSELTNRRKEARSHYEQCLRDYPLSYYALLAFNRLKHYQPQAYNKLTRTLISSIGKNTGRWKFRARSLFSKPAFVRGIELTQLGFHGAATNELSHAGISLNASDPQLLWIAAVVFDNAEMWHLSHIVPRDKDTQHTKTYPLSKNFRRWAISYPKAFEPLVTDLSRQSKLPPELTWAIMRAESAFSPTIESYANAIGLMQLILPTARAAAKRHHLSVDAQTLRIPETNIKLGTTYLSFLMRSFSNQKPLAIAGYNAGHGAVYRWIANAPNDQIDLFVEKIPYRQTRRYVKRVMANLFAYSALYASKRRHRIPNVLFTLPKVGKPSS